MPNPKTIASPSLKTPLDRAALVIGAVSLLAIGLVAGLIRLGWWGPLSPRVVALHGPLMVCGFLGTFICLERAVALGRAWAFAAPTAAILGNILLLTGAAPHGSIALISLASLALVLLFGLLLWRHRTFYMAVMAAGALCWCIGNLLWLAHWPVYLVVWWWAAFLVLTIVGERLELGRLMASNRWSQIGYGILLCLLLVGLLIQLFSISAGTAVVGTTLFLLALWLSCFDLARRTVRQPGLPRLAAVCLLSGYGWLAVAGILAVAYGGVLAMIHMGTAGGIEVPLADGPYYDAVLHALFLGFVFAMIFGHAPIIFPALLRLPMDYAPRLYLHWALLQLTLAARLTGDMVGSQPLRQWAGLLNVLTIAVFFINTALSIRRNRR